MAKQVIVTFANDQDAADFEAGSVLGGFENGSEVLQKTAADMIRAKRHADVEAAVKAAQSKSPDPNPDDITVETQDA